MTQIRFIGVVGSRGLLAGPLAVLRDTAAQVRDAGTPEEEAAVLKAAIESSVESLSLLIAESEGAAAEILAFQVAMLEDGELSAEAFAAIAGGTAADAAWRAALAAQIEVFASADDDYFRARSADLTDLRDRVLRALCGSEEGDAGLPPGAVALADDLTPSRFLAQDWAGRGIALRTGSASSHVAMLARAYSVPMVLNLRDVPEAEGTLALLDAEEGAVTLDPAAGEQAAFAARCSALEASKIRQAAFITAPAATAGGAPVGVFLNVTLPEDLEGLDPAICDGIGLVRTEFLFHGHEGLPDEQTQVNAYEKILRWAQGRPVIVRTLDAGGDKPIPGLTREEENPFLGLRGLRLCLARPEVFKVQLRALLRAAPAGTLRIMLPMVALPEELEEARALLIEAATEVGFAGDLPPLGIMVEIPAAALTLDRFAIDFASIGSNDLVQFTLAAARGGNGLERLQRADYPAVLRLIAESVERAARRGIEIGLCGDAGGDPALIPALLATGLRRFSMAPSAVGAAKEAIARSAGHG